MSFSKKERAEYNQHRDRVSRELGITRHEYNRLRRTANSLSDADTNWANGTHGHRNHYAEPIYKGNKVVNEYNEKHWKKDTGKAFAKSRALHKKANLRFYHQQDPRGASLYVSKGKKLNQENYNREGKHIY